jgi:hypothetical protein
MARECGTGLRRSSEEILPAAPRANLVSRDTDIDTLRKKLAARRDASFVRLSDAVSELRALHSVSADEIRAVVEATIRDEDQSGLRAVVSERDR